MQTDDDRIRPEATAQAIVADQDQVPEDLLYTYVIVRGDLEMDPGKAASQAAHAARLSLLHYVKAHPERLDEFISLNSCGSLVVLEARKLPQLEAAMARARAEGLPCALFSDKDHVPMVGSGIEARPNPHFDGSPVITALAIGPAAREAIRPITKRFGCLR